MKESEHLITSPALHLLVSLCGWFQRKIFWSFLEFLFILQESHWNKLADRIANSLHINTPASAGFH